MNRLQWWSRSEEATIAFGEALGKGLASPAWLGLCGPLGAGKTRLAQGVARALGFGGRVRSPSYVLEHRYRGDVLIRHLDLYRLEEPGEDLEASWEEDAEKAVVLVEWAERVLEPPPGAVWVRLAPQEDTGRWISLEWDKRDSPLRDLRLEGLRRVG
jgi:tRNA threonylcarbamoyladenosine biosynthesis protein TsaE